MKRPLDARARGTRCAVAATLAFVLAACTQLPVAHAYHDKETPSLEASAYLLRHGELQLGLLRVGLGLWRLQLSTQTMPWILGATLRTAMPNLRVDGLLLEHGAFALSANAATYYFNSRNLTDVQPPLHIFLIPFGATFSWRINDQHTVSINAAYLRVVSDSASTDPDELAFESGRLTDNLQLGASWEWRFTRVVAVVSAVRYLPYQANPSIVAKQQVNVRTTLRFEGEVNAEDLQGAVAGSVRGVFSWSSFNLSAGVAYGALFMPSSGLVLPVRYPYPEINFYWRWQVFARSER